MKITLIVPLLLAASTLYAQPQPPHPPPQHPDPIMETLFPPELIMHNAEAINLTDEQREKLEAEMQKAHERFEEMHAKLDKQRESTASLLKKERVNESAALAQFEKVLDQEREIRRAQLALMVSLKNKLTREQQTKLEEIKKDMPRPEVAERRPGPPPGKPPPASLREKMKKVHAGVKKLEDEGGDASSIGEIMQELKPLMDEGKFKQAEELLDQALKALQQQQKR